MLLLNRAGEPAQRRGAVCAEPELELVFAGPLVSDFSAVASAPVVPPLASEGRPVESVPVVGAVAAAPEPGCWLFSAARTTGFPESAALGPPGPGSEFTRVSRPQPPASTAANPSPINAITARVFVFISVA